MVKAYFTEHFLPINGKRIQLFLYDSIPVRESLTQKAGAYVLTIDTRNNGQESITAKQADFLL